jgi:serine/threonine-protein kinase
MEYVDGEDLASLLTRIGRLPGDKALQAARQLCAGLAAAHERGVIHRDLKPQNIMINKRGDVVIMDFGLAAISDQLSGAEVRNGTPAYMSPEQLRGAGVTQASDIYALGLVLYELFTGRRPFEAKSLQQLIDLQASAHLASMTSIASDVDPAVEKVIRRCLDPDPAKRPPTALAAAGALPGGDPLFAALAAGETPSPELVAAAGTVEGLARRYSIPCLIIIVASLFGASLYYARTRAMMRAPSVKPPEVLADRARQIAASFGYPQAPADSDIWLEQRSDVVARINAIQGPKRWEEWLAFEGPIRAIYRESPAPLIAQPAGNVTRSNPPMYRSGMATVTLDGNGRLLAFEAVPPDSPLANPIPAEEVFRAARLDIAAFREVPPTLVPDHASDTIRAWTGPHPVLPNIEMTLQLATWRGRVTQASTAYSFETAATPASKPPLVRVREIILMIVPIAGTFFAALVARRNWKRERSDRQGGLRYALAYFFLALIAWACYVHPVPTRDMLALFADGAANVLAMALILWLVYLAIEPVIRSRYPHSLITWNRLVAGRWSDPQVAGDVLIGAALGCVLWLAALGVWWIQGSGASVQSGGNLPSLLDARHLLGRQAAVMRDALMLGLPGFAIICFVRRLVRYDAIAAAVAAMLFTLTQPEAVAGGWADLALYLAVYGFLAFLLMRVGLIATLAALVYINIFPSIWLGADWKAWYVPTGIATILLWLSVALLAFWKSLGSRDLLGEEG